MGEKGVYWLEKLGKGEKRAYWAREKREHNYWLEKLGKGEKRAYWL
jgi:hypothetical protein